MFRGRSKKNRGGNKVSGRFRHAPTPRLAADARVGPSPGSQVVRAVRTSIGWIIPKSSVEKRDKKAEELQKQESRKALCVVWFVRIVETFKGISGNRSVRLESRVQVELEFSHTTLIENKS